MKITEVKIKKVEKENSKLRGYVTIVLDDAIVIHRIKIIEGASRIFLSFPSRKNEQNEYVDIVSPINRETRDMIEKEVLGKYQKIIEEEIEKGDKDADS